MPENINDLLSWLALKKNALLSDIQEALKAKLFALQKAFANQQLLNDSFFTELKQIQRANNALNKGNEKASIDTQIQSTVSQNQQPSNVTATGPNGAQTNYTSSLKNIPLDMLKAGQFYSSAKSANWNIVDSNNKNLPSALKQQVVTRLSQIDSKLYNDMANNPALKEAIPGLKLETSQQSKGITSYNFTADGKPLSSSQRGVLQDYYNKNFDQAAGSLAKTGDPFTIKMGPSPALQQQQKAQPLPSQQPSPQQQPPSPTPTSTSLRPGS